MRLPLRFRSSRTQEATHGLERFPRGDWICRGRPASLVLAPRAAGRASVRLLTRLSHAGTIADCGAQHANSPIPAARDCVAWARGCGALEPVGECQSVLPSGVGWGERRFDLVFGDPYAGRTVRSQRVG